jgi:hypothetical protein
LPPSLPPAFAAAIQFSRQLDLFKKRRKRSGGRTFFGEKLNLQQTTIDEVAAAQLKAWREAADKIQAAEARCPAGRRNNF